MTETETQKPSQRIVPDVTLFPMEGKGYLIEMQRIGTIMRVTALDPATGREVVMQGPASAGEAALSHAAIRKLTFILKRESSSTGNETG